MLFKYSFYVGLFALCAPTAMACDEADSKPNEDEFGRFPPLTRCDDDPTLQDEKSTFTFVWENDSFANTDRSYTNGMRLAVLSGKQSKSALAKFVARNVLGADDDAILRRGLAIGQSIFTPTNIEETAFIPDEHPYAGWLYGEYSAVIAQRNVIDQMSIQIGMVGPSAGGEFAQNEFHYLIGIEGAKGWDHQVKDELGVVLTYERKARRLFKLGNSDFGTDLTPNYGISVGNVYTQARAGLTMRMGQDLNNDYGPPRVRPSLGGAGYFTPDDQFSWHIFAGAEARAVAHNIFIEGSLLRKDPFDLTLKNFVTDYQAGLVVQMWDVQFALSLVQRSKEFEEQDEAQRFGAFSLSKKF